MPDWSKYAPEQPMGLLSGGMSPLTYGLLGLAAGFGPSLQPTNPWGGLLSGMQMGGQAQNQALEHQLAQAKLAASQRQQTAMQQALAGISDPQQRLMAQIAPEQWVSNQGKEPKNPIVQDVPQANGYVQKVISYDNGGTWQPMGEAYQPMQYFPGSVNGVPGLQGMPTRGGLPGGAPPASPALPPPRASQGTSVPGMPSRPGAMPAPGMAAPNPPPIQATPLQPPAAFSLPELENMPKPTLQGLMAAQAAQGGPPQRPMPTDGAGNPPMMAPPPQGLPQPPPQGQPSPGFIPGFTPGRQIESWETRTAPDGTSYQYNAITGERKAAPAATEGQYLSAGFADRMAEAEAILADPALAASGTDLKENLLGSVPLAGNFMVSPEYQRYDQAKRSFINAQLRRESGAVISPSEFDNAEKQYFPRPGDTPEVLAQKARNRQTAVESMRRAGGSVGAAGAPAQTAPQPGMVMDGYRFKGGDPADKNNWEPL